MDVKDKSDRKWLTCVATTLVTLLETLEAKKEQAHLESYISTLTVLMCSAPLMAANIKIVSHQLDLEF